MNFPPIWGDKKASPSVSLLHGDGYQFGGSIGAGSVVSVDYNIVPNGSGNPYEGISLGGIRVY